MVSKTTTATTLFRWIVAMFLLLAICSISAAAQTPNVVYAFHPNGSYLNPTESTVRFDFDTSIESVTWEYIQEDVQVASGTTNVGYYTNDASVKIPVQSAPASLESNAQTGKDITLRLISFKLADGTDVETDIEYTYHLTTNVTAYQFYYDMAYPGKDLMEFKAGTTYYLYCVRNSKVKSATCEAWQNGVKLGEFNFLPSKAGTYNANPVVDKNRVSGIIKDLDLRPGNLTIKLVSIEWIDMDGSTKTTEGNLGEVVYQYKGNPGKITGYTGLSNGVKGWFAPGGTDGILTLNFDKQVADGATAALEYGSNFIYFMNNLPVTIAPDRMSLQVDLRGRLLTIDALTNGESNEVNNTIILTVKNLTTLDGSAMIWKISDPLGSYDQSYFSETFDYTEGRLTLGEAMGLAAGESAQVNVDNVIVTYVNGGRAFIENASGSLMINDTDETLSTGRLSGIMGLKSLGYSTFEIVDEISEYSVEPTAVVNGTEIAKGTAADNAGRLVTFKPTNTESMGYDEALGTFVIDGTIPVADIFEVLDVDFDWDVKINSITGLLVPFGEKLMLAPRSADDIEISESEASVSFTTFKASAPGTVANVDFDHARVTYAYDGNMFIESNNTGAILINWDSENDEPAGVDAFVRGDILHGTLCLLNLGNGSFANLDDIESLTLLESGVDPTPATPSAADAADETFHHRLVSFENNGETSIVADADNGTFIIDGSLVVADMFGVLEDLDFDMIESINSIKGIIYPMNISIGMGEGASSVVLVPRDINDINYDEVEIADPNMPEIVYASVRKGGLLSPKIYTLRLDFDREIKSMSWAYVQDGVTVASGNIEGSESNSNYKLFNIPVNSASLLTKISEGELAYGQLMLILDNIVLGDDTEITTPLRYPLQLCETPTVSSIYPAMSYPGNDYQELKTTTTISVSCTGNKMVSGVAEIWQDDVKLSDLALVPFSSSLSNTLKYANIAQTISETNIHPGVVMIRVKSITWLNEDEVEQTTTDESLADVKLQFLGQPGKVTGTSGLAGGVKSWFDPMSEAGVFTLHVDRPVADGVTAEFEYGTDQQAFVITGLPVSIAEDRLSISIDLRGKLLTLDAITQQHGYIFYDETGNEMNPPSNIILNVRNMKTTDGAPVNTTYTNEGRTTVLSYWSKSFAYSDSPVTVDYATSSGIGKTVLLGCTGATITYAKGGNAFIQDDSGAAMLVDEDCLFQQGILDGSMAVMNLGNGVLQIYGDAHDIESEYSNINGTVIAKGTYASNVNRLVTFNASNTDSMVYDEDSEMFIIDNQLLVTDLFYELPEDFDWTSRITSITGLLIKLEGGSIVLAPRSANDIITVELVSIADAAALAANNSVFVNVENAVITFESEGLAFIEDASGAAQIQDAEGALQQGHLSGYIKVNTLGDGALELVNTNTFSINPTVINGTVIEAGTYADNANRLVTFNATNTQSMSFDENLDAFVIDEMIPVFDMFEVLDEDFDWTADITSITGILYTKDNGTTILCPRSADDISAEKVITIYEAKQTAYLEIVEVTFHNVKVTFDNEMMGGLIVEDDRAGMVIYSDDQFEFQRGDVLEGTVKLQNISGGVFAVVDGVSGLSPVASNDLQPTEISFAQIANSTYHHRLVSFLASESCPIVVDKIDQSILINNQLGVDLRFVEDVIDFSDKREIKSIAGILYPLSVMIGNEDDDDLGQIVNSVMLIPRSLEDIVYNETSGVDSVTAESDSRFEVYNLQGMRIKAESQSELKPGFYIVNGSKVLVK